jgi:hypothetical protein
MSPPVRASSRRWPSPMMPTNRCRLPRSATIAIFVSRTLNVASALANRISVAATRSIPPPMHQPSIAEMMGVRQSATAVIDACHSRTWASTAVRTLAPVSPVVRAPNIGATSLRSRPNEKLTPLPLSTIARTAGSASSSRKSRGSSIKKSNPMEGVSMETKATSPSRSTEKAFILRTLYGRS